MAGRKKKEKPERPVDDDDDDPFHDLHFLIPESFLRAMHHQQQRYFEEELMPKAVAWDETNSRFAEAQCYRAETFRPPRLFDVAPIAATVRYMLPEQGMVSPCGHFLYVNRTLPRGARLDVYQGRRKGYVCFDGDVVIPILCELKHGRERARIWMSLTPMEMLSLRRGITLATGKVLVGGLGLGWLLHKVCAKSTVKEVIVVERSEQLMDWLRPRITDLWPEVAKVSQWLADDVFNHIGKHGVETRHLLDIWSAYGDARRDRQLQGLKKNVNHIWAWGDQERGVA